MKINHIKVFKRYAQEADLYAYRIQESVKKLTAYLPLTEIFYENITSEQFGYLEHITTNFNKLHRLIESKLFPTIVLFIDQSKENKGYNNNLNLLEKHNLLPSAQAWLDFKIMKNQPSDTSPIDDATIVKKANNVIDLAQKLILYWSTLEPKIEPLMDQFKALQKTEPQK